MVSDTEVTVDYFLAIALGRLKLLPVQFFEMRLVHFFLMVQDYFKAEEQKSRFAAEMIRLQTTYYVNNGRKESEQLKPQQLWKFPWDDEIDLLENLKDLTREEFEASYREFLGV